MEIASQDNEEFPDVIIKLEQEEEEPCHLRLHGSGTFPGTSSGFSDVVIKEEDEEELCVLDQEGSEEGGHLADEQSEKPNEKTCPVVLQMEDKKRRVSYEARFKQKVILYAEAHGNRQAARQFNIPESNVRLWRQHKLALFSTTVARKKFTGPQKGRHPDVDQEVLKFIWERRNNGLPVTSDSIRNKASEVAAALSIPRQVFKASRGWVDRFMKRMGVSLRQRKTLC
uniref:HTH CENPB-type domain-containing protein n=1 Tax=Anolis carolinensis TaxID=28377 RepID=R4GBS2_ANOCA